MFEMPKQILDFSILKIQIQFVDKKLGLELLLEFLLELSKKF